MLRFSLGIRADRPWPACGGTAGSQRLPGRYPARLDTAPSKEQRMAGCFDPSRRLAFSLRNSNESSHLFPSPAMGRRRGRSRHLPTAGRRWTVVSGYTTDNRRKTMLACGGRKWHNLELEYPASDKSAMDKFVTRASYALSAYNRAGC